MYHKGLQRCRPSKLKVWKKVSLIFDAIADKLIAPLLGERMRQTVMRSSLKDIAASMRGGHF